MFNGLEQSSWAVPIKVLPSIKDQLKNGVTFNVPKSSYLRGDGTGSRSDEIAINGKHVAKDDIFYFWVTNDERRRLLARIDKKVLKD
jgi:hypothetical protein